MDARKVRKTLERLGAPEYRLRQVLTGVFRDGVRSYAEITTLPAPMRAALEKDAPLLCLSQAELHSSSSGDAHKALLRLHDGRLIETVLMQPKPGKSWSACVSSQVGCALGCTFCATGRMGLLRNLGPEEICDQVLFWKQFLKAGKAASLSGPGVSGPVPEEKGLLVEGTLDHIVYMGMGEPFNNYEAVAESLRRLTDPDLYNIADRHIAVSTVGLPGGIDRFSEDFPQVNLAISLHAATDTLREKLVPAAKTYPLSRIGAALRSSLKRKRRKVFIEWVLLRGVNDGLDQAKALVRFIRATGEEYLLHVNLIVYNRAGAEFEPSEPPAVNAFRDHLKTCGISVTVRKSLGADIHGACGQLATPKRRAQ
ncbi:MAG: 23S rRNA (adenine(2503)-C(2))-methyltransferase RlmN [Elusimicrobiota bacterium]|jgi:adenine C2-methylase RlmN of 23S rRNA A2503 and tRNA A37